MNKLFKSGALSRLIEENIKKLHFLFLLAGGLMIAGCPLDLSKDEVRGDTEGARLTVTVSYGGSVTQSPDQPHYLPGSSVTLTANPASGYVFTRWEGGATGSENPTTITMDGGKTVRAVFTSAYLIIITQYPGSVGVSPDLTQYEPGTVVTLTANPPPGYVFVRWEGDATGSENPTTITMDGARRVVVIFAYNSLSLTIRTGYYVTVLDPNQRWTEKTSYPGIPFGSVAVSPNQATYKYGTGVTLTANCTLDYQFARWERLTNFGDLSWERTFVTFSENPVTTITMDSQKEVRAVFVPAKPFIQPSEGLIKRDVYAGSINVPDPLSIQITNDGIGTLSGLAVSFPYGKPGWLSATLSDSTAPATLTVRFEGSVLATVQAMPEGAQVQSTILITSPVAMNSPELIDVTVAHAPRVPWTPPPGPLLPPFWYD